MELVVRLKKIVAGMLFFVLLMGNSVYAQENAYTVKLPDSCRTPLCYDSKNPENTIITRRSPMEAI